jgi:hypothetical protein
MHKKVGEMVKELNNSAALPLNYKATIRQLY